MRVLFPSWRFFEDVGSALYLQYRLSAPSAEPGPWRDALRQPPRRWSSFLLNAEGNLFLAAHSLLQRLESEIGELDPAHTSAFEGSVSFRLTQNLVQEQIRRDEPATAGMRFQFRVTRSTPAGSTPEPFLISSLYEVGP